MACLPCPHGIAHGVELGQACPDPVHLPVAGNQLATLHWIVSSLDLITTCVKDCDRQNQTRGLRRYGTPFYRAGGPIEPDGVGPHRLTGYDAGAPRLDEQENVPR
uniref:Uncharacterized protein n=1 Tax=Aureimonas frigidaquae TaxID=424757 RepID=A0A0P0Z3D3_9HYPH|nr:hypothetical protein [Aureimonas frigidaquae]